jgi:hypothetical protein
LGGGPPRFKPGFTCPALLRCQSCQVLFSSTGLSPFVVLLSRSVRLRFPDLLTGPTTPESMTLVWALPISLAATLGISKLIYFPLPTKMFQFGRYCLLNLFIQLRMMRYYSHRVSPFGFHRVYAFFQLTDAYRGFRVLLRLLIPRHPPAALNSLTKKI